MMRVIESVTAFDAEAIVVRRAIATLGANDGVVLHVIGELAADAAIRTHAINRFIGNDLIRFLRGRERTGRAGLHTFAARDTGGKTHRIVEIKDDFRCRTTERVTDDIVHLFFAAGAHAACALDAGVEIDRHGRMRKIRIGLQARRETGFRDTEPFSPHGQFIAIGLVVFWRRVGCQ